MSVKLGTAKVWDGGEWVPASGGGGVLSVQRGVSIMDNTSLEVTIDAVDAGKSFAVFETLPDSTAASGQNTYFVRSSITSDTTLRFDRNNAGGSHSIAWRVVELASGSVQQVGGTLGTTGPAVFTFSQAVDLDNAFLVGSSQSFNVSSTSTPEGSNIPRLRLISATEVEADRASSPAAVTVNCFVVDP